MSLPRLNRKPQSPWLDLAIFACVTAFFAYSFLSASKTSHRADTAVPPAAISTVDAARGPASISTNRAAEGNTDSITLSCFPGSPQKLRSHARLLQLHAPLCLPTKGQQVWNAKNESSGEEIQLFVNKKEKMISTNFFTLMDGENRIRIDLGEQRGKKRLEWLEIQREVTN